MDEVSSPLKRLTKALSIENTTQLANGNFAQDALDFGSLIKASHQISKQTGLLSILKETLQVVLENSGAMRAVVIKIDSSHKPVDIVYEANVRNNRFSFQHTPYATNISRNSPNEKAIYRRKSSMGLKTDPLFSIPEKLVMYASRSGKTLVFQDISTSEFSIDSYFISLEIKSVLCVSLRSQTGKNLGIMVYLEHPASGVFTESRIEIMEILLKQVSLDVEKAQTYEAMAVFFADIRSFSTISESLTVEENFEFVNSLLSILVPALQEHGLVIDKFIGDAIMALCASGDGRIQKCSENAIRGAIAMQSALTAYNSTIDQFDWGAHIKNVRIGVGIHTGSTMLAIDKVTINLDTVNTASRIESITKLYSASLLISEVTYGHLTQPSPFHMRMVDEVVLKGQSKPLCLYEVIEADPDLSVRKKKIDTIDMHRNAMNLFRAGDIMLALSFFESLLKDFPEDGASRVLAERCRYFLDKGIPNPWTPTWVLKDK
ncbi:hypothetical protein HDU67_001005 [Dinochytrium kinnereticum]|nr:hypothetical protein HDU67_001005 [Dinochytrium kinnereticum]